MESKEELKNKAFPFAVPLIAAQLEITEEEVIQKTQDKNIDVYNQIQNAFEEIWQRFLVSMKSNEYQSIQYSLESNESSPEQAENLLKTFQGRFIYFELVDFYNSRLRHGNLIRLGYNISQAFMYALFYCLGYGFKPLCVFNIVDKPPALFLGDAIKSTAKAHTYYYLKSNNWHLLSEKGEETKSTQSYNPYYSNPKSTYFSSINQEELNFEAVKFSILLDFLDMTKDFLDVDPGIRLIKIKGKNMKRNEVCSFIYDKLKESFQPYSKIIKDEPHTEWVFTEGSINCRFSLDDPECGKESIDSIIGILSSSLMGSFVRLIWTSTTEEHTIDVHASHNSNVNYFQVSESSKLISCENPENTQCKLKALSLFPMDDIENSSFKFHITSLYLDENWNPERIDMNVDQLIKKYSTETNEESLLCKKLEIHYNKDTFCEAIRHLDGGIDKGDFLQGQLPFVDAIKWSLDFALKLEPKYPIVFGHRAKKHPALDDLNVMASLYEKKWKELCQQMKVSCQESKPL